MIRNKYHIAAAFLLAGLLLGGCGKAAVPTDSTSSDAAKETAEAADPQVDALEQENEFEASHDVQIDVEGYGTIKAVLVEDAAPETVENFAELAEDGFYDGLTFHRIISGFMIQGGDPLGNGTGGSEKTVKGEFAANGVNNPLSHTRGAISMARSNDPDSGSSQFFIVHEDSTFLDGSYACFGYVTEGMDVVDKICKDAKPTDDNGTIPPQKQPVIESITVEER